MNYPAASRGVTEERAETFPKASPPNVFIGARFQTRLDSRFKHTAMTGFGKKAGLT
jgi:hypothetical protein